MGDYVLWKFWIGFVQEVKWSKLYFEWSLWPLGIEWNVGVDAMEEFQVKKASSLKQVGNTVEREKWMDSRNI